MQTGHYSLVQCILPSRVTDRQGGERKEVRDTVLKRKGGQWQWGKRKEGEWQWGKIRGKGLWPGVKEESWAS